MNALQQFDLLRRYDRALNLRRAIERSVHPDARVLDAGCGVGLLSLWAVQSGARDVIAVDVDGVDLAVDLAAENGFADSIQFVEGDLRELDLPGGPNSFDVILAMIYLNDPRRDEQQSALTYTLRDRYLSPTGDIIPDRVTYIGHACDWPSQDHSTRLSQLAVGVADLGSRYGLGFRALHARLTGTPWHAFFPPRRADGRLNLEGVRILSEPAVFAEINYTGGPIAYPGSIELVIGAPGVFNTVLWTQQLWFQDMLLFSNESVSWVAEPCLVEERARCMVLLEDMWRRENVVSVTI